MTTPTPSTPAPAIPTVHAVRHWFVPSLWLGVIGSSLIWAAHLQLLYTLVPLAKKTDNYTWLYGTTALCLVLTIFCGVMSYRDWRAVQSPTNDEPSEPVERSQFLSLMGMTASVFFAITIIATGCAAYFFKASWD